MECKQQKNKESCPCTTNCSRSGKCCECVRHHRDKGQFPACFFTQEGEAKHDRSFAVLLQDRNVNV